MSLTSYVDIPSSKCNESCRPFLIDELEPNEGPCCILCGSAFYLDDETNDAADLGGAFDPLTLLGNGNWQAFNQKIKLLAFGTADEDEKSDDNGGYVSRNQISSEDDFILCVHIANSNIHLVSKKNRHWHYVNPASHVIELEVHIACSKVLRQFLHYLRNVKDNEVVQQRINLRPRSEDNGFRAIQGRLSHCPASSLFAYSFSSPPELPSRIPLPIHEVVMENVTADPCGEAFLYAAMPTENVAALVLAHLKPLPRHLRNAAGGNETVLKKICSLPPELYELIFENLFSAKGVAAECNRILPQSFWRDHLLSHSLIPWLWDLSDEAIRLNQKSPQKRKTYWDWERLVRMLSQPEIFVDDPKMLGLRNRKRIWENTEQIISVKPGDYLPPWYLIQRQSKVPDPLRDPLSLV